MLRVVLVLLLAACLPQVGPPVGGDSGTEPDAGEPDGGTGAADAGCPGYAGCLAFTDGTAAGHPRTITFGNGNDTYSPQCLRVRVGQTVTFNGVFSQHPLVQACGPSTVLGQSNGSSAQYTFPVEGTWGYYCTQHGSPGGQNMAGAIEVVR